MRFACFLTPLLAACSGLPSKGPIQVDVVVQADGVPDSLTTAWVTLGLVDLEPCPHARWRPIDLIAPAAHAHGGAAPPPTGTDIDRSVLLLDAEAGVVVDTYSPTRDLYCGAMVELRPADDRGKEASTAGWFAGDTSLETTQMVMVHAATELEISDEKKSATLRLELDLSEWDKTSTGAELAATLRESAVLEVSQ